MYVVYHGEDAGRLQVGTPHNSLRVYAPLGSPLGKGIAQILGSRVADIAPELIIIPIGTHGILVAAYGNDVDTLARSQTDCPVIAGHTRNDVVMGDSPATGHMAVFYPQVAVVLINFDFHLRVLQEHRGVWLERVVHYFALVVYPVLDGQHRRHYLVGRTEVVELSARQGQYGHTESAHLGVVHGRLGTQTAAKLAIQVIVYHAPSLGRTAHEHLDSAVRQQPHAYIGQVEMLFLQLPQCLYRRFLEHTLQPGGRLMRGHKDTVVLGYLGAQPQAIAHHVDIGDGLQGLGGPYVHIAAHYHGTQGCRGLVHNMLIERHL